MVNLLAEEDKLYMRRAQSLAAAPISLSLSPLPAGVSFAPPPSAFRQHYYKTLWIS